MIEGQEIKENHTTNSSDEWSPTGIERDILTMNRQRTSTEVENGPTDHGSDDEGKENFGFAPGLVKSNSVVARASMWQQLQQQAKGWFYLIFLILTMRVALRLP